MTIYVKKVSVGSFLKKGEDIKDGDSVEIMNEGTKVPGEYGMQDIFIVKTADGKEGNVGFNQTSINNIIDGYGADSKNWVGQKAKAWFIRQMVKGKMTQVLYFSHPDAEFTDDGFSLNGELTAKPKAKGKVSKKDIPVVDEEESSDTDNIVDIKDLPF
jgi:hypothetical protein